MTHRTTLSAVLASSLFILLASLAASLPNAGHAQSSDTPEQCTLSITPATIDQGQSATIAWEAFPNLLFFVSSQVSISPDIGSVPPKGSRTITPAHTTAYTMNASLNVLSFIPISTYRCAATVTVNQPAVCTPTFSCSGNGVRNSCTGAVTQCAGGATCSNGQCVGGQCLPPDDCTPTFSCSGNGVHNSCTGAIAQCVGGSICLGDQCMCPSGQHWDDAQNRCVTDSCPAGQVWNGTQCIPNNCPAGQTWNGTQCVTDNCPAGQHWNGVRCVPDNTCPAGQTWNGSACACPTGAVWYQNQCQTGMCIPGLECGADGNVYRKDLQCELSLYEECEWGCTNAICNPPPQPKIITWKVSPTLVKKNDTTGVYWNVLNVFGCTVSGTNGDLWSIIKGSEVSSPLIARTTYTLHCTPYKGAAWVDQTAVVNIVPEFQEQ